MEFDRQSGLFLHIASLPGPDGIGTLGDPAETFVDFLADSGQSLWQFCPLGPTIPIHDNSPYQSYSAFAGNPLFLDLDDLVERGWLEELDRPDFDDANVEYEPVREFKEARLEEAFETFQEAASDDERAAFEQFKDDAGEWLEEYALYRALRTHFDGVSWLDWPEEAKMRDPDALERYREELAETIEYRQFLQWLFDQQWSALKEYANERGVKLVGDVPIYVDLDSADVWANPEIFKLDEQREPEYVSGVPPDEFSDDGQMWGTPVYDWAALAERDYGWWVSRFERLLQRVDIFRIDHFKAFESYWEIPADADTAREGEWVVGPHEEVFYAVRDQLGDLPIVVEDLGEITEEMDRIRDDLGYPGMNVAAFADWCDGDSRYHPVTYDENSVAYTSTHDTDTLVGWYEDLDDRQLDCLHYAVDYEGGDVHWDILDTVWGSDSAITLAQVQDPLGYGSEARFNVPGTEEGNWSWRVSEDALTDEVAQRLYDITEATGRLTD
ncbi:4-alpha-glucanotransferase [Halapricum desulfuricans]|uniref:4-alpha-glucanotransferase n=1 Tax=Halapricum desulfuricans TaxID=2841257 RepID=A0A897N8G8_9EURY|nr:4-alpha-glucanotransferase [Halapricum desulfuricans]QSG08987.1 4-alpha-glucanotransferase [Halapricum desulfuricans]